jgi:hypothetical protein
VGRKRGRGRGAFEERRKMGTCRWGGEERTMKRERWEKKKN